jgi:hypothetical protein
MPIWYRFPQHRDLNCFVSEVIPLASHEQNLPTNQTKSAQSAQSVVCAARAEYAMNARRANSAISRDDSQSAADFLAVGRLCSLYPTTNVLRSFGTRRITNEQFGDSLGTTGAAQPSDPATPASSSHQLGCNRRLGVPTSIRHCRRRLQCRL